MDLSIRLICTLILFGIMVTQAQSHSYDRLCLSKTGFEPYNNKTHICCDGEVKRRVRDQACCAEKTTYFQSTRLCCGGQVVDRYHPQGGSISAKHCTSDNEFCREQVCCGNKTVDNLSSLCCQDTHVLLNQTQISERDFLQCCGVNVISRKTHFCCGGSTFPINSPIACCGNTTYQKSDHKCLDNFSPPRVVKIYENFCNNSKYDVRTNSCCSEVLNAVPERDPTNSSVRNRYRECCDSIVYNNTKNKCCRARGTNFITHIIPNEATVHCCGNGWYNSTHQDCHNGTVLEKMPGMIRCAYEYIDGVNERCCGDVLNYNDNSHQCCIGDHISVIPNHMVCCNGQGLHDNQLCCDGIKRCDKRHADDDDCCYNSRTRNGTTFNSRKNEYCVEEEVMIVPPGAEPCSRSNYYYPTTQICCSGRVENMSSGYDQCCGTKPYKSKSQQCCDTEISNMPPTEGSCCLKDSRVYRIGDVLNPCMDDCGNKRYHAVTHVCCSGTVHARHNVTDCCGTSGINSMTTKCCGELFPYSASGNVRCCGDRELFDKRHSKCQHNKIVPLNSVEKGQPDVQQLCYNTALIHFDGAIRYACESTYVVQGRLLQVVMHKDINPDAIYIKLSLADVRNVNRGANFTALSGQKTLSFTIEVPNSNGVTCRKRYLDRCCNVFVFFSAKVKNGHVTIGPDSKFFMTKYNRKRENMIKKHLPYQYCIDKFGVGKKKAMNS